MITHGDIYGHGYQGEGTNPAELMRLYEEQRQYGPGAGQREYPTSIAPPSTSRDVSKLALPEIHIDLETRSTADLKRTGLYVYAEHPTTDVWCACYAIGDDGPVQTWRPGQAFPEDLRAAIDAGSLIIAHNSGFEHALWDAVLTPRYGWPTVAFEQFDCTAAMAAAMGLPRDLARAAMAMGLDEQKDQTGKRLMLQLAKPRRVENGVPVWWDVPEKVARLIDYCIQDVEVERALTRKLRRLSAQERRVWLLDHKINARGVKVDIASVKLASIVVKLAVDMLNKELETLTGGRVEKATNHMAFGDWLRSQGIATDSVDKETVTALLKRDDLSDKVRRAILIRQECARSSLAKLEAFLTRTSKDGRTRETLMYHGAGTGRWSGRGIQLQNLLRPWMKYADIVVAIEQGLRTKDPSWLEIWGRPLDVVANMMRSFVIADNGHEFLMADYANIEGRVLAWLAGETPKLRAFEAYDTLVRDEQGDVVLDDKGAPLREGPDLYKLSASGMMGVPLDGITDFLRQIGKVSELALGYQGGHGAFISMGKNYRVYPSDIAPAMKAVTDPDVWATAADGYEENNRFELIEDEWVALRVVVDAWRRKHPMIVKFWDDLDAAAMSAVRTPGKAFHVRSLSFAVKNNVLWCRLPSGRVLAYIGPLIQQVKTPWGAMRDAVTFMGMDDTNNWSRHKGYGGHWAENVTQAVARDIMADAMLRMDDLGWDVVLTVHDEVVCELPTASVSPEQYGAVMRTLADCYAGLPVAAEAVRAPRYRK